jgi:hypothetical protein
MVNASWPSRTQTVVPGNQGLERLGAASDKGELVVTVLRLMKSGLT